MAVAEGVLVHVGLQVLRANRAVHATQAALQQAPKALDGIRVRAAVNVDAAAVVNGLVDIPLPTQPTVGLQLVSIDCSAFGDASGVTETLGTRAGPSR